MPRLSRPLAGILVLTLLFAACGDEEKSTETTVTTTTSTSLAPAGTTATTDVDAPPVSVPATNELVRLTDVRAAGQPTGDRVTFEFEPSAPGYNIAYVTPPLVQDGSGEPVAVKGQAFMSIHFPSADAHVIDGENVRETSRAPKRFSPGDTQVVEELVQTGDYEANVTWGIGLKKKVPFKVTTLTNPARVVVDFED